MIVRVRPMIRIALTEVDALETAKPGLRGFAGLPIRKKHLTPRAVAASVHPS